MRKRVKAINCSHLKDESGAIVPRLGLHFEDSLTNCWAQFLSRWHGNVRSSCSATYQQCNAILSISTVTPLQELLVQSINSSQVPFLGTQSISQRFLCSTREYMLFSGRRRYTVWKTLFHSMSANWPTSVNTKNRHKKSCY